MFCNTFFRGVQSMNIENIRCFISLAECLNFTKAAMKEHITQTTMSRKISVLEEELGATLLYRDTREVHLTSAGSQFYSQAVELVNLYDRTVEQVQSAQQSFQSELKIGIGTYEHVLLNQLLEYYLTVSSHDITFNCQQEPGIALARDFIDGLFDIIICVDQYEQSHLSANVRSLGIIPLYNEPYFLVLHKDNPIAAHNPVPLTLLNDQTLITMRSDSPGNIRQTFREHFSFQKSLQVNSLNSKLVMINSGLGFSWVPRYAADFNPCYRNLVLRETAPPYRARKAKLYYRKDASNPATSDFINNVRDFLENGKGTFPRPDNQ